MLSLLALSCAAAPTNAVSPYLPSGTNLTQEEIAASHEAYFKSPRKPEFMPRPAELYGEDVKSNFIESTRVRGSIPFSSIPSGVQVRFENGTVLQPSSDNFVSFEKCYDYWCDRDGNCHQDWHIGCQVKEMRVNPALDYIEDPAWGHYRKLTIASNGVSKLTVTGGQSVSVTWSASNSIGFELEGSSTGVTFTFEESQKVVSSVTQSFCINVDVGFWFYAHCGWINYYTVTSGDGNYDLRESGDDAGCVWEPLIENGEPVGQTGPCQGTGSNGTPCGRIPPEQVYRCS
ncbi:hypothetical protein EDD86DRAFT_244397 [Gorgonomyces haynaldii]|nr:hypothetical protein EDD86DRAFT_244397 [Gorgonomyces haynaldii]